MDQIPGYKLWYKNRPGLIQPQKLAHKVRIVQDHIKRPHTSYKKEKEVFSSLNDWCGNSTVNTPGTPKKMDLGSNSTPKPSSWDEDCPRQYKQIFSSLNDRCGKLNELLPSITFCSAADDTWINGKPLVVPQSRNKLTNIIKMDCNRAKFIATLLWNHIGSFWSSPIIIFQIFILQCIITITTQYF